MGVVIEIIIGIVIMVIIIKGGLESIGDILYGAFDCKKRSISTHPKRGYPFTFFDSLILKALQK